MTPQTLPLASSDAEIRAFLRPLLKAGKPPTYKAMRATLGGGFSRLARIKKQVERELAGETADAQPVDGQVVASGLVARLEGLFERQWKAIEEWERRAPARVESVTAVERSASAPKAKGGTVTSSAQADRLEAVERRLLAMLEKLQGMTKAPVAPPSPVTAPAATLGEVPPAWARQAAAAATSALDGRLQSIEEAMRESAAGARGAFDLAAEVAREVAADASLQIQMARSTLTHAVRKEFEKSEWASTVESIRQNLGTLQRQVDRGFAASADTADRRAAAIRDVILAMTEIEMAQVDLLELGLGGAPIPNRIRNRRRKIEASQLRRPRSERRHVGRPK